jgi:TRIAP1/MDM35 family protein
MAHSLSSECTPLKHAYDSCFNAWFAGYLEPTLTPHQQREKNKNPQEYQKQKAEEYQQKCGKVWESYKECVQVCIHPNALGNDSLRLPLLLIRILSRLLGFLESDQG